MKYSQNNEQDLILDFFKDSPPGYFLDIGAYHPFEFSNTRALFDRGWSGAMVDMSPFAIMDLMREYGDSERVSIISGAVSVNRKSLVESWISGIGAISTTDKAHRDKWQPYADLHGEKFSKLICAPISIQQLLHQLPAKIEFVNIDVEGSSAIIGKVMPWNILGVRAAVIEHDYDQELIDTLVGAGFKIEAVNGENVIVTKS